MRTNARFPRMPAAALAALTALAAWPATAAAQAWSSAGAPVCTAPGQQDRLQVVSDGAGGVFVGWSDQRPGSAATDVYLARIGPDGAPAPGWPADGMPVCTASAAQLLFSMAPDGSGGVFLAWEDYRNSVFSDVYGHHVLADGQLAAGWPADGLPIALFLEEQRDPKLVPDGSGGVFCVWADARTYAFSYRDIFAQHLHGDGTPAAGWAANGMRVTNARTYDFGPSAAPDQAGGLYVTWTRGLGEQDIGAQHLGANGAPYPTWPDTGIVLCGEARSQNKPWVVGAPGSAAMAVWWDQRNYTTVDTETDYYVLRFGPDTSRAAGWPRDGRQAYASLNGVGSLTGVTDGAGGIHFLWGELVSPTDEDLFVMHVDSDGTVVTSAAFPEGVVAVCPDTSYQHPEAIVPDGAGGVIVAWTDYRDAGPLFSYPDPYVQRVTAGATIAANWPATGVALTKEPGAEGGARPAAVAGGVIAAWVRQGGQDPNVFASLVGDDGVVPALVSLVSSEAAPDRVRVTWQVAGGATAEWRIERRDDASPWREIARALPDGSGRVSVSDGSVAPGARYGYRLAPAAGGAALGETWIEVPLAEASLALLGAWPNPAVREARVRFALPSPGEAALELLDAQGRRVHQWRVGGAAGVHERALDGLEAARPGLYWLRLSQAGQRVARRFAIVR